MHATIGNHIDEIIFKQRYGFLTKIYKIALSFGFRVIMKLLKIRKLPAHGGRTIVITGPDGSGKSTLVSGISDEISKTLPVVNMNIGRPYGAFINSYLDKRRQNFEWETEYKFFNELKIAFCWAIFIAISRLIACWRCYLF